MWEFRSLRSFSKIHTYISTEHDWVTRKGRHHVWAFRITIDLFKASGTKLAHFHTIFHYSVPINVWIYENGAEEFESYYPHFTLISLLLNAAFKPCKRRKIEKARQWKEDKRVEKKRTTFLLIFISSPLEIVSGEKENVHSRREYHFQKSRHM